MVLVFLLPTLIRFRLPGAYLFCKGVSALPLLFSYYLYASGISNV